MTFSFRWLLFAFLCLLFGNSASAHYDPRMGRWLSRDPLGEQGGFNLYAYCGNDPVNRHDPLGLSWNPFTSEFWSEGWAANKARVGDFAHDLSWAIQAATTNTGPDTTSVFVAEILQNSVSQNADDLLGGLQEGGGRGLLSVPDSILALSGGTDTFINRALGSAAGIPDSELESADLRSNAIIGMADLLRAGYDANTRFAIQYGANSNSQLFQAGSRASFAASGVVAPELIGFLKSGANLAYRGARTGASALRWITNLRADIRTFNGPLGIGKWRNASSKTINVGPSGHHVPAIRKTMGRLFEVGRADKTRPTIFSRGVDPAHDHWRLHDAERPFVGPRQGPFAGTDDELFAAYRNAYRGLDDIRVDVRSPDGTHIIGTNVSPLQAVDIIESWLREQGLR